MVQKLIYSTKVGNSVQVTSAIVPAPSPKKSPVPSPPFTKPVPVPPLTPPPAKASPPPLVYIPVPPAPPVKKPTPPPTPPPAKVTPPPTPTPPAKVSPPPPPPRPRTTKGIYDFFQKKFVEPESGFRVFMLFFSTMLNIYK